MTTAKNAAGHGGPAGKAPTKETEKHDNGIQKNSERQALVSGYIAAGFALVQIPRGSKAPKTKGWQLRENAVTTREAARGLTENIGLAHAYCTPSPTGALDVDDRRKATIWLAARGIDLDALLAARDAVQIVSGRDNHAKVLYRLPRALRTIKPEGSGIELRCASDAGHTVQDVLPPSIHPDTGRPYQLHGDIGAIPSIPPALVTVWQELIDNPAPQPTAVGDSIPEGSRNSALVTFAGAMRRPGMTQAAIEAALLVENEARCAPPLPRAEVRAIAKSIARYAPEFDALWSVPLDEEPHTLLWPPEELAAQEPPPDLVSGMLPPRRIAEAHGEPGSAKSFFALDLVLSGARGVPFLGRRMAKFASVYISAEGAQSLRLRAYAKHHGIALAGLPVRFVPQSIDLRTPGKLLGLLLDEIRAAEKQIGPVRLIVVDTVSRTYGSGDENSSKDMAAYLAVIDKLARAVDGLVLLVHHVGKNPLAGARGHSSLKAAVDVEIEIARDQKSGIRTATITKSRDGKDGAQFSFRLEVVQLGPRTSPDADALLEPLTSCVVVPCDPVPNVPPAPTGENQKLGLRVLTAAIRAGRKMTKQQASRLLQDKHDMRRQRADETVAWLLDVGHMRLDELCESILELP